MGMFMSILNKTRETPPNSSFELTLTTILRVRDRSSPCTTSKTETSPSHLQHDNMTREIPSTMDNDEDNYKNNFLIS
jgi:hypothetical protein